MGDYSPCGHGGFKGYCAQCNEPGHCRVCQSTDFYFCMTDCEREDCNWPITWHRQDCQCSYCQSHDKAT